MATVRRYALLAALTTLIVILARAAGRAQAPPPSSAPTAAPTPQSTAAPRTTLLYLNATRLDFFYNRFLIEGDGKVSLRTSDGFTVTGDAFTMDLKLNRFMVAGHVTLHDSTGTVSGAAISDFLDFRRIYFVPITSEPDRWTFLDGDLAHPVKGRVMPGDAFYFPVVGDHPSITATSAVIGTKTYVRFINAHTYFVGAGVPLGSYVVNFSPNQYFAQNTLSGASVDLTWNLAGNTNSLSAVHLRYDPTYKTYLSVEQHLVGDHEYAIFSVNPATRAEKWWNLALYEKLGSRFQIQSFTQYYSQQFWLQIPRAAQQTTYIGATYALPHSYITATSQLTNYNVLGPGSLEVAKPIGGSLAHPSQLQVTATSFQNRSRAYPSSNKFTKDTASTTIASAISISTAFQVIGRRAASCSHRFPLPACKPTAPPARCSPRKPLPITAPSIRPFGTRSWALTYSRRRSN